MIVLVDTNILLDVIQERHPHDVTSSRVWKLAEEGAIEGYVSAISFNNIFYIARKYAGVEIAREAVRRVRRSFKLVPLDEVVIDQALSSSAGDLEDGIQAAAAQRVKSDYLITRNVRDFRDLGVTAISAQDFLAIVKA